MPGWTGASVPASYALGVLTIGQLYAVAFGTGTFSVLFTVCQPALFVALVPGDQYVDGNSLVYGSRALSFLGSAYFLSRIRPAETPPGATGRGALTAGARFIRHSAVVRASLTAIAVVNFFMFVFSAVFVLYAVRSLHVRPGLLGLILGAGAIGGFLAALVTKRLAARLGAGRLYTAGCLLYTAPLVLVPLAAGREPVILGMLLAALFISGFGVMALDISIGAIFAVVIPDQLRSRVTGAFQTVNYGSRPLGALGFVLLLPSALPRFRMPPGGGQGAAELEASAAG